MVVGMGVVMTVAGGQVTVCRCRAKIMLVEVKPSQQQQHENQTRECPNHD